MRFRGCIFLLLVIAAIAVHFCTRGMQVSPEGLAIARRAQGHLLVLAALLFLLKAAGYRLAMFDLLFSRRGHDGYGAVVSPVNRVTREGLPEFWVKDLAFPIRDFSK